MRNIAILLGVATALLIAASFVHVASPVFMTCEGNSEAGGRRSFMPVREATLASAKVLDRNSLSLGPATGNSLVAVSARLCEAALSAASDYEQYDCQISGPPEATLIETRANGEDGTVSIAVRLSTPTGVYTAGQISTGDDQWQVREQGRCVFTRHYPLIGAVRE